MRMSDCCSLCCCFRGGISRREKQESNRGKEPERISLLEGYRRDEAGNSYTEPDKPYVARSIGPAAMQNTMVVQPLPPPATLPLEHRIVCNVPIREVMSGNPKETKRRLYELMTSFFKADPCFFESTSPDGVKLTSEPFEYQVPDKPSSMTVPLAPHVGYASPKGYLSGRLIFDIREGAPGAPPYAWVFTELTAEDKSPGHSCRNSYFSTTSGPISLKLICDEKHPTAKELAFGVMSPEDFKGTTWVFKTIVPQVPEHSKRRASVVLDGDERESGGSGTNPLDGYEYAEHAPERQYAKLPGETGSRPVSGRFEEIEEGEEGS